MTVGAAGALNVILHSILNPKEEVIIFKPFFLNTNFILIITKELQSIVTMKIILNLL